MGIINEIELPDGSVHKVSKKCLTKAEYDALSEDEKNNGTVYLISDVASSRIVIETLINIIYPVGSIYISVTDDTVAKVEARFGGTWEVFAQGRTLVGVSTETEFNTVEKTGGEKTHTLGIREIPAHRHTVRLWINAGTLGNAKTTNNYGAGTTDTTIGQKLNSIGTWQGSTFQVAQSGWGDQAGITDVAGDNGSHNNLQPYITTYMYKRIA